MLVNLNSLANNSRKRYKEEFQPGDVLLTDDFKREFGSLLRSRGSDVVFYQATSTVTTIGNKKIYVPNQWYLIAAYMVDYVNSLFDYKYHLERILDKRAGNTKERENYIKEMKMAPAAGEIEKLSDECHAYFIDEGSKTVDADTEYMVNFLTDYDWWFGSKTIDRGDFFVSPVLGLLEVVNVTQGYIADICAIYASSKELTGLLEQLTDNTSYLSAESGKKIADETRLTGGINLIVYGAPGTGKSRYMEDRFGGAYTKRVVFHPEYTYFDFVGTYKPVPLYKRGVEMYTVSGESVSLGEPIIDYQFVPGPFTSVFVDAFLNPNRMYTLLIEEINRANAASVFGEIFQLLDRKPDGSGEYMVDLPKDMLNYLESIDGIRSKVSSGITMLSNINIVATMNSADQGVNLLDAAFKRRWEFKYIKVSVDGAVHERYMLEYGGINVYWGSLVMAMNNKLKVLRVEEDRLVGPYFIKPDEIGKSAAIDKLLLYLWDDVLRHRRDQFFDSSVRTFSDLVENFPTSDVMMLSEYLNLDNNVGRKMSDKTIELSDEDDDPQEDIN